MKKIISLFCIVVLISGCATTGYNTYTDGSNNNSGICEQCGKVFTINPDDCSNTTSQDSAVTFYPGAHKLHKGMTKDEVRAILDHPESANIDERRIIWYYPNKQKAEFWKSSKNADYELTSWVFFDKPATPVKPPNSTTCPYCGRVQDINEASNRYDNERQIAQNAADRQAQQVMGSLIMFGLGMALRGGLQTQAPAQALGQSLIMQQAYQSFKPAAYRQPVTTSLPRLPSLPRFSSLTNTLTSTNISSPTLPRSSMLSGFNTNQPIKYAEYDVYGPGGPTAYEVTKIGPHRADMTAYGPGFGTKDYDMEFTPTGGATISGGGEQYEVTPQPNGDLEVHQYGSFGGTTYLQKQ